MLLSNRNYLTSSIAMVAETIARYGCVSTAMCYVMHIGAVAALLFRHHKSVELDTVLRRLDKVGTTSSLPIITNIA